MSLPGSGEWLMILGVALLIFGPNRLPQLGSAIGSTIKNFRKGLQNQEDTDHSDSNKEKLESVKTNS
jgi:sec-independent protein translocase protein TatA